MTTAIQENQPTTIGSSIVLQLQPALNLSENEFFELCRINRDLRIERTAHGEMIVMAPAGSESSDQESEINMQLRIWAKRDGTGTAFSSSGGFRLPNGAVRAPDASWISHARLNAFTAAERRKFLPLCPEFVIELRSPSDSLAALQAKMEEYLENGAKLGLLLVPETKRVYRYQPNQPVEVLENLETLACDPVLPGFELVLREIW